MPKKGKEEKVVIPVWLRAEIWRESLGDALAYTGITLIILVAILAVVIQVFYPELKSK